MTAALRIVSAGPGVSVQDAGRPGHLAAGLSVGGAADRLALAEGAALLGQPPGLAAVELAASTLTLESDAPVRIALTGAPMKALAGETTLAWNASHTLYAGTRLTLTPRGAGFAVLSVGGGIETTPILGSRAVHTTAGIGRALQDGDTLPVGANADGPVDRTLDPSPRFAGGEVRVVPGPQTAFFGLDALDRLAALPLRRGPRGNRQGVALDGAGAALLAQAGRQVVSDAIVPGDIQITGDGQPYVLGPDCQTTGGYPRIATVIPADLPVVLQAPPGTPLRFVAVDAARARTDWRDLDALAAAIATRPLLQSPTGAELLRHQLIDGVTRGEES